MIDFIKSKNRIKALKKDYLTSGFIGRERNSEKIYEIFKKECFKFDRILVDEFSKQGDLWTTNMYDNAGTIQEHTINHGLNKRYNVLVYKKSKYIKDLEKFRAFLLKTRAWLWVYWNDESMVMNYGWLGKFKKPIVVKHEGNYYLRKDFEKLEKIRLKEGFKKKYWRARSKIEKYYAKEDKMARVPEIENLNKRDLLNISSDREMYKYLDKITPKLPMTQRELTIEYEYGD